VLVVEGALKLKTGRFDPSWESLAEAGSESIPSVIAGFTIGSAPGKAAKEKGTGVDPKVAFGGSTVFFASAVNSSDFLSSTTCPGAGVEEKENPIGFTASFVKSSVMMVAGAPNMLVEAVAAFPAPSDSGAGVRPKEKTGAFMPPSSTSLAFLAAGTGSARAPNLNPEDEGAGAEESAPNLNPPALGAGAVATGVTPNLKAWSADAGAAAGVAPKLNEPLEPIELWVPVPALTTGALPNVKPVVPIDPLAVLPLSLSAAAASFSFPGRGVSQDGHLMSF
jgi:hypothetical protein